MSPSPSVSAVPTVGNFLWSAPRSASTAFFRAIESHPDMTQVILEPYCRAYHYGEERVSKRSVYKAPIPNSSFHEMKRIMEEAVAPSSCISDDETGHRKRFVFVKDMAYPLYGHRHEPNNLIPRGYRHAILVRHPAKTVTSLYRLSTGQKLPDWTYFEERESGFKELWQLYELLRDAAASEGAPPPLVIETDDLQRNPEKYLRAYCDYAGLPFHDSLLKWNPAATSAAASNDCWESGWFSEALDSNGFWKLENSAKEDESMPECVARCIQDSLEFYERFQRVKIRLD